MTQIIVDSRESRSGMAPLLAKLGLNIVSQELEVGDYVLAEGLGVERKAAVDFIGSIMDRRLFLQAPLMKQAYKRPFIIVEGNLFNTRSAIEPAALMGALSYLSVMEGISVLHTHDPEQTAMLMATMHRHATEGLGYEIALRGGKPKDRGLQAQYLIEGLPGIGPKVAKQLLSHFGCASDILAATAEDLRKVPGIGPKTVLVITEVLAHGKRPSAA